MLIFDWSDTKSSLIHFRLLKVYIGHGMVVDKIHEVISFKQSKWLENFIAFNKQKRKRLKMISKKTSTNYSITHFMVKQWKK